MTPPAGARVTDYKWDNGGVIDSITNLQAGTYRVTITLSNGCLKDTFAVVRAPAPITIDTATHLRQIQLVLMMPMEPSF